MIDGTVESLEDEPYVVFRRDEFIKFLDDLHRTHPRLVRVRLPYEVRLSYG